MEKKNLKDKTTKPKVAKKKKAKKVTQSKETKQTSTQLDVDKKYRMVGTGKHLRCPKGAIISLNGRVAQIFLNQGYATLEK